GKREAAGNIKKTLLDALSRYEKMNPSEIKENRYQRFRKFGFFETTAN
ncbi:MAG: acetyl-CoA carboxylase carboxyl transferase subunit alpha, partial [Proteobacteria bacterium]|nr:acetyl-CoA carboxylase carboxyl transferase subunit alpha [Pseudomonadota bacterium]